MPNWCNNAIEISGNDEQIDALSNIWMITKVESGLISFYQFHLNTKKVKSGINGQLTTGVANGTVMLKIGNVKKTQFDFGLIHHGDRQLYCMKK